MHPWQRGGLSVGFRMQRPGVHNKTRFMHDAIYILKITLLQWQSRLPPQLRREVVALAEFVCLLYVPYFLQTPLPVAPPRLDRDFYVDLEQYRVLYYIYK